MVTCRYQITEWVKDQIEGESEVSLPALATKAVEHFAADPAFVEAFFGDMLRPMVYQVAQSVVSRTRTHTVLGDTLVDDAAMQRRVRAVRNRWDTWLEHVDNRHVRLVDMTKRDLIIAASSRRGRASTELETAALFDALAERLEGTETVGERFTSAEIDAVFAALGREQAA